jgi:hypothetical protein
MKTKSYLLKLSATLFVMAMTCSAPLLHAQGTTVYQYRHVPADKADEFVKRETTYWSKVAQKAIDAGKMSFWALLEKVGGTNLDTAPNYLFINTFPDIDADLSKVFDATKVFPGVPESKMDTYGMSTVTEEIFVKDQGWQQAANAVPGKDFNYILFNYHNATDATMFDSVENTTWAPFIKSAMDKGQSDQMAWGNSIVLAPTGGPMKFNCFSYDIFSTLKAALSPTWSADVQFPVAGLDSLQKLSAAPPARFIYRIIKVVTKN